MGKTSLIARALLHVNWDAKIDIDNAIDIFVKKKERALESVNICDINSD